MLNIIGAFVLIGNNAPRVTILGTSELALYRDRIRVSGFSKADAYTFGHDITNALPCTTECMEFIALNFTGTRSDEVRQICARIALRQPIGNGKDLTEGGQGARIDAPVTRPNPPGNTANDVLAALGLQS